MKTMEAKKTKHISRRFRNFLRANEAVSALEYALLVGIVAVGLTGAIVGFSGNIEDALTAIGTEIGTVSTAATAGTPTANN